MALAEFLEDDVILYLNTLLVTHHWNAGRVRFRRVSQWQEKRLGYDGTVALAAPLYLQAKRPQYVAAGSRSKLHRERQRLGFDTHRGFFTISPRREANTREFRQHNALWAMHQRGQHALYVAPLFHTEEELDIHYEWLPFRRRFGYGRLPLHDYPLFPLRIDFEHIPLFHGLAAIPPHRSLAQSEPNHSYAYSHAREVSFHSKPESIHGLKWFTLSELLRGIVETRANAQPLGEGSAAAAATFLSLVHEVAPGSTGTELVRSAVQEVLPRHVRRGGTDARTILHALKPEARFVVIGYVLWEHFRIAQFLIVYDRP